MHTIIQINLDETLKLMTNVLFKPFVFMR